MNKNELSKEFYLILQDCDGCPMQTYKKFLEVGYEGEELNYMCRLLYRWVEWQKIRAAGGRIYYEYIEIITELKKRKLKK